jgi:predicted nucleic acid-binding protein
MIVVADTSPLNYLVLLGHIEILAKIYGEVVVPQTVLDELQDNDAPAEVRAWFSARPAWLQVSTLIFRRDPLMDRLDRGEQDAILLAESFKAERLIIFHIFLSRFPPLSSCPAFLVPLSSNLFHRFPRWVT